MGRPGDYFQGDGGSARNGVQAGKAAAGRTAPQIHSFNGSQSGKGKGSKGGFHFEENKGRGRGKKKKRRGGGQSIAQGKVTGFHGCPYLHHYLEQDELAE